MDLNSLMSMMGQSGGNNVNGILQVMNMFRQLSGGTGGTNKIREQLNNAIAQMQSKFVSKVVDALYQEYPTDSLACLFKPVSSKEDKIKILKDLTNKALPSVLDKLNEGDIDLFYEALQNKRK